MSVFRNNSVALRCLAVACALALAAPLACAQAPSVPLDALATQVADLRETTRFLPDQALQQLLKLEVEHPTIGPELRAEVRSMISVAHIRLGQHDAADKLAEELLVYSKAQRSNIISARALLTKAYVLSAKNDIKLAHQLAFEAEALALKTPDAKLRIQALVGSGQSYAEQGDFPQALRKLQQAVDEARPLAEDPVPMATALNALAWLYAQMKEYEKGFAVLDDLLALSEKMQSPGRMAITKGTEYALAADSRQMKRAMRALYDGLEMERKLGATRMMATTLVNLSDGYLKMRDYPRVVQVATEAIAAAQQSNDQGTEATGRINLGQAYLSLGRIADGKKSFEAGLAYYEKANNKPDLQVSLMEYGEALERAGDMGGAVAAYHRERGISNELFEKQRQKAVLELQEKYETEKKERQIELLSRENQVKGAEIDNRRLQQRIWWLLALVFGLASMVVGLLYRKVRHANAQLEVKNLELKAQSSLDPLTLLYNRRHFQDFMRTHNHLDKRDSDKRNQHGEDIVGALFLLDVDHFKNINDNYGHAAGDAVLKMIAENLRVALRETDMIVRWGGEEFLAFLPAVPRHGVEEVARRILVTISSQTIEYQDHKISVNVSVGFAPFPLVPGNTPLPWERAVNLVDMALYLAKAHGRNRAYGVRGFTNFDKTSMEAIEQDLERAWRGGFVDLSVVLGGSPDSQPPAPTASSNVVPLKPAALKSL
ncbi:MAG: diguanylate cyclase [Sphingomonadaceae bacterium]